MQKKLLNSILTNRKSLQNIFSIGFFRAINIGLNFLVIPLTINYINPTIYGVWLVLLSIVSWFSIFDIGLGNGLRNNLTISLTIKDYITAKKYISTTYISLGVISIILFILLSSISYFCDWNSILEINFSQEGSFNSVIFYLIIAFCIRLTMQLIITIYYAVHEPIKPEIINATATFISLVIIFLLKKYSTPHLLYLVFSISYPPILVMFFFSIHFFKSKKYQSLTPSFRFYDKSYIKNLLNLGIKFFILQISVLVSFTLSDFLILKYLTPNDVTKYNIVFKFFSIITVISSIICAPMWSSFTKRFVQDDMKWIKQTIKKLLLAYWGILFSSAIMLFLSDWFYIFWTGIDLNIPFSLSLFVCLYMLVAAWNGIFVAFINGVGKVKLQMYLSIIPFILTIPLSYFLIVKLSIGVTGMAFCLFLFNFISSSILTYQAYLIINKKDKGIWAA